MEAWWAKKTLDEMWYCYNHQDDEPVNIPIPPIDVVREEGQIVFKIFGYGNFTKYYCKVFDDPDSDFDIRMLEEDWRAETQD